MSRPLPRPIRPRWTRAAEPFWPWAAAAASGLLLSGCFAPWNQAWLCWLALAPLTAALWFGTDAPAPAAGPPATRLRQTLTALRPRRRWARGFALGYVTGTIFYWCAFYWLTEVTGPGWFILGFYMGLYAAVWGSFLATVGNPQHTTPAADAEADGLSGWQRLFLRSRWNLWFAFLGASAWTGLEWLRGIVFSGFGWNTLGSGLHAILPFIQMAEWTGVGGLTFLAAFANLIAVSTVYRFALEVRIHRIRPHFDFTLTIAAMLLVFAWGFYGLQRANRQPRSATVPLRVSAVQPNIPQLIPWDPARSPEFREKYRRLTEAALLTHPQLLLWPEASTPESIFADQEAYQSVLDISERAKCNFLLGTLDFQYRDDGGPPTEYNTAFLLPRDGDAQMYHKTHLVPFGEYIPFRHSFPLFAWIVGDQVPGDLTAGTEPTLLVTQEPEVRLGPLICFEDSLGRVARRPVLAGAQVLVNITNDSWFGRSAACEQHLAESVFRTVENRRPLIRCSNTGVTAFIDRNGRVERVLRSAKSDSFVAGVLTGEIRVPPADAPLTFYTRHGEVFSGACAAAALAAVMLSAVRKVGEVRRLRRFSQIEKSERKTASDSPLQSA